jgi:hypothetical protein
MRWFHLTAARTVTPRSPERGDVPGWVLITGMTVALVMLIWGVASDALRDLITGFLSNISFGG